MPRDAAANGRRAGAALLVAFIVVGGWLSAVAQTAYQQPPEPIAKMLDAAPIPLVMPSPDGHLLLELERPALPPIADVAVPTLRLAGDRIDTRTTDDPRRPTLTGLRVQSVDGGPERVVALPAGSRIHYVQWSRDARRIGMVVQERAGGPLTIWVAEVATGAARPLNDRALDAAAGQPCAWLPADEGLICRFRPTDRGAPPEPAAVPAGPTIQQSSGRAVANPTYEDLLAGPSDEELFDYYYTAQLARVALNGALTPLGAPAIIVTNMPSPDGRYVLVESRHRPYSYRVPQTRFPTKFEVWDASTGRVVSTVADAPLQESVPISFDAVPVGPREVRWRSDEPATLVWVEATDHGDPAQPPVNETRDRLLASVAPFTSEPAVLAGVGYRITDVAWGRANLAVVTERWWNTRQRRTWAIDPSHPSSAPRRLFERSFEDRYADPGTFVTTAGAFGAPVLLTTSDGRSAYLSGDGASPEGDRPFLDRVDLASARTTRVWRSAAPYYERVAAVLDPAARRVVTRRESAHDVPQYVVRDIPGGALHQLTHFVDPAPEFANITKQLITYTRADGVQLSATLYLPAGYTPAQGRLPFFFWAYPREFKSAAAAAQVVGSPYRFVRPVGDSPLFMVTQGYGVLDGPTMPIIGEGTKQPNDTYVEQLVASAQAAVDKVVAMGV